LGTLNSCMNSRSGIRRCLNNNILSLLHFVRPTPRTICIMSLRNKIIGVVLDEIHVDCPTADQSPSSAKYLALCICTLHSTSQLWTLLLLDIWKAAYQYQG
ncbi:LOW QUALITY PROTEIN: hypothetical protein FOXG_03212, partial [Fusarium oxysporum f. sp. lycopersici 4287]|uniref:Uncharacterized protein n=2 Tax=Fusarium oxysporum TaxID=5507 RepID=A0A0D2XH15_FUSOF